MIKKLKKRFILSTLLAVLLVLLIMMGTINLLNYRSVVRDADQILTMLAENGGEMPDMHGMKPPEERNGGYRPEGRNDGNIFRKRNIFNEETPFESRFFTVTESGEGSISSVSTINIAAVTSQEARSYAEEVFAGNKTKGFLEDYRYRVEDTEDGRIAVFLDCTRSLANVHSFLLTSLAVSLAAFAMVALFTVFVSGRILKPVAESYEKQKGFITDAGHELKTPVAVIEADASVLELEIGENEWVDDIKKQTRRLAELTGELTYLARMDEGRTDTVMISFPISDVVEDTADSFRSRAKIAGKAFRTDIAPMLEYTGDEAQIRKLTSILLDNAVKYSTEQGEIRLRLNKKGKNTILSVFNTAENIDTEMLTHMFDRFYRGDKSRSSENGGFGIGLSIASAIVDAHHGRISASARGNDGIEITAVL